MIGGARVGFNTLCCQVSHPASGRPEERNQRARKAMGISGTSCGASGLARCDVRGGWCSSPLQKRGGRVESNCVPHNGNNNGTPKEKGDKP